MLTEEAILGTILKENHLLQDAGLKEEYFSGENRILFKAMQALYQKGMVIDLVTLLTQSNHTEFGGASKLNKIQSLANVDKFDKYTEILMDKWRETEKINILEIAKHEDWDLERITNALNSLISSDVDDHQNIKSLLREIYEEPWNERPTPRGINTGLKGLQAMTNGFQNTDLIILAARPSMGKTDMMLHFVKQAGWQGCLPIVFSLEMSAQKLRDRMIASTGNINRSKMKNLAKDLSEKQKESWATIIGHVSKTNVQIFDRGGQSIREMRMKIRKIKNENPDKQLIVFVDYLTLIKPAEEFKNNMHLGVSDISKSLKAIAKEFNCPVISLAQLSRSVEKRPDKRPMLSDLRESGSIEEDADLVMFLYRDAYYTKNEEDKTLEIIIAKNREGAVGMVKSKYNNYTGAIVDVNGQ